METQMSVSSHENPDGFLSQSWTSHLLLLSLSLLRDSTSYWMSYMVKVKNKRYCKSIPNHCQLTSWVEHLFIMSRIYVVLAGGKCEKVDISNYFYPHCCVDKNNMKCLLFEKMYWRVVIHIELIEWRFNVFILLRYGTYKRILN